MAAWTNSAGHPQALTGFVQCVARSGRAAPAGRGRDLIAGGGYPRGQVGDLGQQRPANGERGQGWRPFGAVDRGAVRRGADVSVQQLAARLQHDRRAVHLPGRAGRWTGAQVQLRRGRRREAAGCLVQAAVRGNGCLLPRRLWVAPLIDPLPAAAAMSRAYRPSTTITRRMLCVVSRRSSPPAGARTVAAS